MGEDTAAPLGGTLLNLVALAIAEQAALAPRERRPVSLPVDEFHANPGADYEAVLAELSKYGANLLLATHSLARLEALDREHHWALRATVFANLDGLFAFHGSAEDARYLVHELGEGVDEHDLVALGEHRCYARLSAPDGRPPTFSVRLDPPPTGDPIRATKLATESALRYGRDQRQVARELQLAIERIEQCRRRVIDAAQNGTGVPRDAPPSADEPRREKERKARNDHRDPRDRRDGPHQATYFADSGDAVTTGIPESPPLESEDRSELGSELGEEERS